jgi:hypothetical protein
MKTELEKALNNPIWKAHKIGQEYMMDGQAGWKIAYYPIFEDGHTTEKYSEPRALVERPAKWRRQVGGITVFDSGIAQRKVF